MAGGSAKKLAKENNARLSSLSSSIIYSCIIHVVARIVMLREFSLTALHPPESWALLAAVNVGAWFIYSFLSKVAKKGTSLTPNTVRGSKTTAGTGISWWIENLQDLIFLVAGTNMFSISSVKMGMALLCLAPVYALYLLGRTVFSFIFTGSTKEQAPEEEQVDEQATRKGGKKRRLSSSKNKTR